MPPKLGRRSVVSARDVGDSACDEVCGGLDEIVGEAGVAGGGLDLDVPSGLPITGKLLSSAGAWLEKAVAQVTNAHVFKPDALRICACERTCSRTLQVG